MVSCDSSEMDPLTYLHFVEAKDLISQLRQRMPKTATLMRVSIRDKGISFESNQVDYALGVEKQKHELAIKRYAHFSSPS